MQASQKGYINRLEFEYGKSYKNFEQWFLITSDRHFDAIGRTNKLEIDDLKLARDRNAYIIDCGDLFDVMQVTNDKRGSKSQLKGKYAADDYLDRVINDAIDYYSPYADLWAVQFTGNHEYSIERYHNTNLINRFCAGMKQLGSPVLPNEYRGYIRVLIYRDLKRKNTAHQKIVYVSHGKLKSIAERSKGALGVDLKSSYIHDADILISGHNHNSWLIDKEVRRLQNNDVEVSAVQTHLNIPSYKQADLSGNGYEVMNEMMPKPSGSYWLKFYIKNNKLCYEISRNY